MKHRELLIHIDSIALDLKQRVGELRMLTDISLLHSDEYDPDLCRSMIELVANKIDEHSEDLDKQGKAIWQIIKAEKENVTKEATA